MINDKKRREVAKKMREYDVAAFKESAIVPFLECLGLGYRDWRGILDTLADLIDRPTCHDVSDFDHEAFKCSRCGHRVLSLGGDSCDAVVVSPDGLISEYYYCPNCGDEVVE